MMTTVFIAVGFLWGTYILVWAYLIAGHVRTQRQAVQAFLTAWEANTYSVTAPSTWETNAPALKIHFSDNNSKRMFDIDGDGRITSDIKWADEGRKVVYPSRYTRRKLEEITQQIATMAKLEGKLDAWAEDDGTPPT